MRVLFILMMLCGCLSNAVAQEVDMEKKAQEITAETKALYNSEWASWYGTDIFLEKCADKSGTQAGFISYDDGKGMVNIFYSKDETPKVISTISFGYSFDKNKYTLDTTRRKFNKQEAELYVIRKASIDRMQTDTTFKFYKNAPINPVPFVYKGEKKVYILTGTNVSGLIPLGNDYLVTFDKENNIDRVSKLHNSFFPLNFSRNRADSSKIMVSAMHAHLKGKSPFITVTDICTLMLYSPFTQLKTYMVISEKYVSLWDCQKQSLLILTTEAWKKIANNGNAIMGGGR